MRSIGPWLSIFFTLFVLGLLQAAPDPGVPLDKKKAPIKTEKASSFKPVEINQELNENDPKDPDLNHPAKEYGIKFYKDKTYIIDLISKDFDAYLRLLDKQGNQQAEDDDGGGDLNARIIYSVNDSSEHKIVVTSFDGKVGKFQLKVREFQLQGEAKAREVGKDGLNINDQIGNNDHSAIGKLGKTYSLRLKAGQTYTIDLQSQALDCYLYLFDSKNKLLAQDDDGGGDLNSQIVFEAKQDGIYHIIASSLDGQETGEITLKISPK